MEWQVLWHERALWRLQEALHRSRFQQLIIAAARRVDETLQNEPESAGESREENFRIVVEWPIVVQ